MSKISLQLQIHLLTLKVPLKILPFSPSSTADISMITLVELNSAPAPTLRGRISPCSPLVFLYAAVSSCFTAKLNKRARTRLCCQQPGFDRFSDSNTFNAPYQYVGFNQTAIFLFASSHQAVLKREESEKSFHCQM